jgi:DNA primase
LIPRAFIDEVLNRVDIVTVISQSVTLKKAGANLQGLCPFHQEKSPSFSVSETKQFYHCFGCGAHGSAISFLMEYAGLTFIDAIEELAKSVGLTVPQQVNDAVKVVDHQQTIALTQSMEKIMGWYQEQLKKNQRAINYLKGRGLSGEIAKRFCMGYAPDAWQNLDALFGSYENEAIAKLLSESGMMIQGEADGAMKVKRYDRFRDRIMFPIRNLKGQVIGFGGRILDKGEPKYLNSPETSLFKKGQTLYVPAYWWYSMKMEKETTIACFRYRTYMNNIAITPYIFMSILQMQNIKRKSVPLWNPENEAEKAEAEAEAEKAETVNEELEVK